MALFEALGRGTRAAVGVVAVLLAAAVSDALSDKDLWVRMVAAGLTALVVIVGAPFVLRRRKKT